MSVARADVEDLFRRWRCERDRGAREELVQRHLPLAHKLARRYARTREPLEDLFQVASLALVKAIDRFDPDRGLAFSSFAVPTILGELKRHFRDKGGSVHMPRGLQELMMKVQDAETTLSSGTGRSPTVVEIAEYLAVDSEQVLEALEALAAHHVSSLDTALATVKGDELATGHDVIGVEDERYGLVETSASLAAAVKRLRISDRQVLALRFRDELKQKEIAERIGVSQMQVSRILRRATNELRQQIELDDGADRGHDDQAA
jgi:RNA polymerase sigma-B factor